MQLEHEAWTLRAPHQTLSGDRRVDGGDDHGGDGGGGDGAGGEGGDDVDITVMVGDFGDSSGEQAG